MAQFSIRQQQADVIQNADLVINGYAREKDHLRIAVNALRAQHYRTAVTHYSAALEVQPDDPALHYGLALALLGGLRPNRHARQSIIEIQRHLKEAQSLSEAQVLAALVSEDYGLYWQRYSSVPTSLRKLINRTSMERVAEIVFHVPARESRTWQELAARIPKARG